MPSPDRLTWRNETFQGRLATFDVDVVHYLVAEVEAMWAELAALDPQWDIPRTWYPPEDADGPVTIPEEERWTVLRIWIKRARRVLFGADARRDPPQPDDAEWLYADTAWVYREADGQPAKVYDWTEWASYRNDLRSRISETFATITPSPHRPHSTDEDGNILYRSDRPGAPRRVSPVKDVRERVRERADGRCELCGAAEDEIRMTGPYDKPFVLDHVVPASLNGSRIAWNLLHLCHPCNQGKHRALHPEALNISVERLARWKATLFPRAEATG